MFDDPINYKDKINNELFTLEYFNLTEICQGCPVVGYIKLNGKNIENYFGGPVLYDNFYLYIPTYLRKCFGYKFKLARISLSSLKVEYFGKFQKLIYLDKLEKNRIIFYEDVFKKKKKEVLLPLELK